MSASLKHRLAAGEVLIGTIVTIPATPIVEILCQAGVDWLFLDLEHSSMEIRDAELLLQAASRDIPCVIRVPELSEAWIKRALDTGAAGVIVPNIRTAAEAERAVALSRYPPAGVRGVGLARAHGYGARFQEYVNSANDEIAVILQVEHADAVRNIGQLTGVPGVDCLFIGPYDLSASMDRIGQTSDPAVLAAIEQVRQEAQRSGIPLGIFGAGAADMEPRIRQGYQLIAAGVDTLLLAQAAQSLTGALRTART